MPRPKKIKQETSNFYKITLSLGKDTYTSSEPTILESLQGISKQLPQKLIKGIGTLQVTYQDKQTKLPIRLTPFKLQRLFVKPVDLAIFAKRVQVLM